MSNLWRASKILMLVVTVLVVAACGPAAQPDTTQATAAPAAGTGATAAPAAGGAATAAPAAVAPPAAPGKYVESAFLANRVKAGKLPPIEQRLPKEPFVVGPGVLIQEEYMKWENGNLAAISRLRQRSLRPGLYRLRRDHPAIAQPDYAGIPTQRRQRVYTLG